MAKIKKTCTNCKYKDIDYINEYPCCECNNKSRWEQWQDTNYQPTEQDLMIAELEQIKAEIEEIKGDSIDYNASDYRLGRYQAFDIVVCILEDKLAELKGENKE